MIVTWLLVTVTSHNKIDDAKNAGKLLAIFDHHGDASVQSGAHLPMKHIKGFTRSHWMLPLGKCLHCIAPVAAMVTILAENTKH
jgi:hypothetical protein